MFWEATLNTGEVRRKEMDHDFRELDPSDIVKLILRETPECQSFIYDKDSNILRMPNLDVSKAPKISKELVLHYDGETSTFSFADNSWTFLKENLQEEPQLFASFGFDESADIVINNFKADLTFLCDEKPLIQSFDNRQLSYVAEAFTDLVAGRRSKKQITGMENIIVTQKRSCQTFLGEMVAQTKLIYEYDTRSLLFDLLLRPTFEAQKVDLCLATPDKLLNYRLSLSATSPSHLRTYIYVFNN